MSPNKINWFLFFKLPSAWFCGVRVKEFSKEYCKVSVKHKWINQNPFRSIYFAVQNMAAELSTGVLVMQAIKTHKVSMSMLVIETHSIFYKKATGRISFECVDGQNVIDAVNTSIKHSSPQVIILPVKAYNSDGTLVSEFSFKWSVKPKK